MRRSIVAIAVVVAVCLPRGAQAVSHFDWHSNLGLGGAYFSVRTNEPGGQTVEDVQARETLGNRLGFESAYLQLNVSYVLTAVQLKDNADLNYIDQRAGINLNLDRWLQRHLEDSRLSVTVGGRLSPSLPPIEEPAPPAPPQADATAENPPPSAAEQYVREDLLNLNRRATGYSLFYGLDFSDEIDPFHRYEIGALVTDNHLESSVFRDSTALSAHGLYGVRLSNGEAGVRVRHQQFLRGGSNNRVYGLSLYRSAHSRRIDWHVEPGVSYRTQNEAFGGSFDADAQATFSRVAVSTAYGTNMRLVTVGRTAVTRSQHALVSIASARNYRFPRSVTLAGSISSLVRRTEFTAAQIIRFGPTLLGVLSYTRAVLWWEDSASGAGLRRKSDVVAFNVQWSFL